MADPRNPHFVSSFHALQAAKMAARQAQRKFTAPATPAADEGTAVPGAGPPGEAKFSRAGKTTLPTRYEIVCLQCGSSQEIVGKNTQTVCPKCRARLSIVDHKIEGEWSGEIVTSGSVVITREGVVKGGSITANNITVEGRIEGGTLRASRLMRLCAGSAAAPGSFRALDLRVDDGLEYEFPGDETEFRHVEVHGILEARLFLTGRLTVHPGALFSGAVHGSRLEIHDGGGLFADLHIEPPATPPPRPQPPAPPPPERAPPRPAPPKPSPSPSKTGVAPVRSAAAPVRTAAAPPKPRAASSQPPKPKP